MKAKFFIFLLLYILVFDTYAQQKKSSAVSLESAVLNFNKSKPLKKINKETALGKGKNKVSKDFEILKGGQGEFYEVENYMIKISANDVTAMRSNGYKGLARTYKNYVTEFQNTPNIILDYYKVKDQDVLIMHFKDTKRYTFTVENNKFHVSGTIYSYDNDTRKNMEFVKDYIGSIILK